MCRKAGIWIALFLCGLATDGAYAQDSLPTDFGAYRDTLDLGLEQPFALRPFIMPATLRLTLNGAAFSTEHYQLDARHGRLWLTSELPDTAALLIATYRTLPFNLKDSYYRRRLPSAELPDTVETMAVIEEPLREETAAFDLFGDSRLERSGSITRGVIMGNRRDMTIESGLRMQLSGEIVDGVNVNAVLTDENTPIQPEGTTQRLSDFDRVFIQLESQNATATLGDFDLIFEPTEFARFSRKMQGISVQSSLPDVPGEAVAGGTVTVAGATSRGIFQSQEIQPIEGMQGPYRLSGRAGEQFIIVIAGSERVYMDGVLLTRGETNDYIIDYATGEVTFTTRRLVTAERRITVDFEYTTNRFTRTLVGSQAQSQLMARPGGPARLRIGATFLREADSRAFNEELGLSSADSLLLTQAGDSPAVRTGAERVPFDAEAPFVQYIRTDTIANGQHFEIFRPATQPVDSVYRVRFSRMEPGQGDYRRVGRAVNGILYEWVGPGMGEYAPLRVLPKPVLQQMVDLHGVFEPIDGLEIFGEWAQSVNDQNRLSPLDAHNNLGGAYLGGFRLRPTEVVIGARELGQVSFEARRRFTDEHFETFDRTRPVEFGRRWNLPRGLPPTGSAGTGEGINEARLNWDLTNAATMSAEIGQLRLGGGFKGTRRAFMARAEESGLPHVDYLVESIISADSLLAERGNWFRQMGSIRRPIWGGRITPFIGMEQERRHQLAFEVDSLTNRSFTFTEWRPGVSWGSSNLIATGSVAWRADRQWGEGVLRDASRAWTSSVSVDYRPGRNFSTDAEVGYRMRRYTEYFRFNQHLEDVESVLIRWNTRYTPFQRALEANWYYEALTERTPLLQETYIRVGPEFGQYVWVDFNQDGIPQIDEFVPEQTPYEGTYARTFVPSDELVPVINVQARLRLRMEPARLWGEANTPFKRALRHVSTQTMIDVQEKSSEDELRHIYLLNLYRFRNSETTMTGRIRFGQDLFLFRGNPDYGATVSFNQLRGMNHLAAGLEERFLNNWRFDGNYRFAPQHGFRLVASTERNRVFSESFASRTYDIHGWRLEPEASWNVSRAVQLIFGYGYSRKVDERPGLEDRGARIHKLPIQARFTQARRLQLSMRAERAHVALDGEAFGLAAFELTDGRGPGTSYLWNVTGQYTINRYLRASFFYDARIPSDAPQVHTVRMQLSAVF